MASTSSNILLSAEPLQLGETVRIHCPTCNSERPTLTITRKDDGGVVWNCYRATCDEKGGRGLHGAYKPKLERPAAPRFFNYEGTLRAIHDEEAAVLAENVGFDADHIRAGRAKYAVEDKRFAFPIIGPNLRRRGWVLRSWERCTYNKALTHMEKDQPHMSWYWATAPEVEDLLVVEDIPSAIRAARYANTVALCGTTCGPEYINELAAHTDRIVWALDDDATSKAIYFHRKYGAMFESSQVAVLAKDIKNMNEAELIAFMEAL